MVYRKVHPLDVQQMDGKIISRFYDVMKIRVGNLNDHVFLMEGATDVYDLSEGTPIKADVGAEVTVSCDGQGNGKTHYSHTKILKVYAEDGTQISKSIMPWEDRAPLYQEFLERAGSKSV